MSDQQKDYAAYIAFAGELARNFDRDWDQVSDRVDAGWIYLQHIKEIAWRGMASVAIDSWDSWPRNWVKNCKAAYEAWRGEHKFSSLPYGPVEDLRFPVDCLVRGYDAIERDGKAALKAYAEGMHMPSNDQNRVEWKFDYITNPRSKMRLAWGLLKLALKANDFKAFPLVKSIIRTISRDIITDDLKVAMFIRQADPEQILMPHSNHMAAAIADIFARPDKYNIVQQVEVAEETWQKSTPPGYFQIEDPGFKDEEGNRIPY
jgi:hypothetical protein